MLKDLPAAYAKASEEQRQKIDSFVGKLSERLTAKLDAMERRGVDIKSREYKALDKRIKWIDQMHANAVNRWSRQDSKTNKS